MSEKVKVNVVWDHALERAPTPDQIESQFAQIADSQILSTAPLLRSLLIYLWNHRNESLSEYAIAVEGLGRHPDFNSRIDASARVQIARLRSKLSRFYAGEGESFPLRLSIPKGGHELKWSYQPPAGVMNPTVTSGPPRYSQIALWSLGSAALALAAFCVFLSLQNLRLQASVRESSPSLPRFWQNFLRGGKPTVVVVPTPVNFRWRNETQLWVRDSSVSDNFDWSKSPRLLELAKRWGPPVPDEKYVVVTHMLAAVTLVQYLTQHNASVRLGVSPRLGIDSSRDQNSIVIGGPINTKRFHSLLSNFDIETAPMLIRNHQPRAGEPAQYGDSVQSDDRISFSGIIALLPRSHEGTGSLLMIGRNPNALVSMMMSAEGLRSLEDRWRREGQPEAWEMVVQAEMNRDTVLNVRPVAFRSVTSN